MAKLAPPADTQCTGDERPANQFTGFDIDAATEIAKRLGVEVCFVTPDWTLITAGGWAGRWDLSIGSMTITPERMEKLYFAQPYYTTPAAFFVHQDNTTFTQPADLSGKKVGGCSGCTYEAYIDGTLSIPGETIDFVVTDAEFAGYDTDVPALEDLALGDGIRLDAVPVSYTHLRAHETVLDLVCRLLLEKRNDSLSTHLLRRAGTHLLARHSKHTTGWR